MCTTCATCSGLELLFFGFFESYNIRCIRGASSTVNSLRLFVFKILPRWPVQAVKPFHKHFIRRNPPKINLNSCALVLDVQIWGCEQSKKSFTPTRFRPFEDLVQFRNSYVQPPPCLGWISWEKKGFVTEQESELGSNQRTNPLRVWSHFPLSGWWVPAASLKPLPTFPFNECT